MLINLNYHDLPPMDEETGYIAHDLTIEQLQDIGELPLELYAVADYESTVAPYRIQVDTIARPLYALRLGDRIGIAWEDESEEEESEASWATVGDLPIRTCVLMFLDDGDDWENNKRLFGDEYRDDESR